MKLSIIIPSDRSGPEVERCVRAILEQRTAHCFELIMVRSAPGDLPENPRLRVVSTGDRNPATRRNLAAAASRGEILAFIDDDAFASPDWVETAIGYLDEHLEVLALGGPDPAPVDSTPGELIAETLLSTRWIGSGVLCHENRPGIRRVSSPHDLALVNLFVRRIVFETAGGFDSSIGYIGEDSALLDEILRQGEVHYHGAVRVEHRRRRFPGPYLLQRWRYRLKTGEMLIQGGPHRRSGKVVLFLAGGSAAILTAILWPRGGIVLGAAYVVLTGALGIASTRLWWPWWPLIPAVFALHHATYYAGIISGIFRGLFRMLLRRNEDSGRIDGIDQTR